MAKILILEDNPERIKWFSEQFINHMMVVVNEARMCMAILDKIKFDQIFLDHDLGGQVYVPHNDPIQMKNTGSYVAKNLWHTQNHDTPVIIHSHNQYGAKNMYTALQRNRANTANVIVRPFSTDWSIE